MFSPESVCQQLTFFLSKLDKIMYPLVHLSEVEHKSIHA